MDWGTGDATPETWARHAVAPLGGMPPGVVPTRSGIAARPGWAAARRPGGLDARRTVETLGTVLALATVETLGTVGALATVEALGKGVS
ncbi:hypothetical protein RB614_26840 [Phytohabitans sp. ZYX-F-186]|uniref:Uncharacterized protein n=1 Tax=Phytohabitans maris TaxID=3071409 RepID=A0ABU0ZP28_9ACTN|nr:hypothetical protein [Phytohabitans sp. ZYX-F-186]MDQ7908147.1 hypothetical protein [Phytohabitans sp. ZYX-F-186]